jgi:hypothetical protein
MYGYYNNSNNNNISSIIKYLVENCYIDTLTMISEYEDVTEVCGDYRPDWFKAYCYFRYNNTNDNGCVSSGSGNQNISSTSHKINRRQITIYTKCLDDYNHKGYERKLQRLQQFADENNACLNNSNARRRVTIGGVIDIKTADSAKDNIMLACSKLLLAVNANNNNEKKKNSIDAAVITSIDSNFESDNNDDGCLFYHAVRMTYDQSEDVRTYFRNNPSKINPNNKSLWPLRYQAYKEYCV